MSIELVSDILEVYQPDPAGGYKVIGQDGSILWVPAAEGNRHFSLVELWLTSNLLSEEAYAASLSAAKTKRIDAIKQEAWRILVLTDWYDIRASAGGPATPAPIVTYRQDIRDTTATAEVDINALTTVNAVRDYTFNWPIAP